jgi:WD40 repeat protein
LENGLQIGKDWQDGEGEVNTIGLSPDGKKVVSGGDDAAVRLWDIDTGKVIAKWMGHSDGVWSVCWSRDCQRVVSGSVDRNARVWDVESGKTILEPINTGDNVYAVVYSPDETMIVTVGGDDYIRIWDAKTHELVTTLKAGRLCLAWTVDGKTLFSGSNDGSVRKWDTTIWKQSAVFTEHREYVRAIAISPNGRILASASYDDTARLWDLENGQPISSPLQHAGDVNCVSFSADGELLATGCDDYNAYTWDVSAILKEAGFDDFLSHSDVSLYHSLLIRRPTHNHSTRQASVPTGINFMNKRSS